ncbi:MAG: NAD-binding protein [Proteobacteria bacterium]|nr:NAD-binding protein [Pseudomonadota bacterium]
MTKPLLLLTRLAGRLASLLAYNHMTFKVVAGLFAFALGLWGWTIEKPPQDAADWFNNLFRTVQLVTLQFPTSLDKDIVWQLNIARFLVPVIAALATFHLIIGAIARPLRMALMPQTTGHIVICGTDRMTQGAVDALAAHNRDIVFVAPKVDGTRREALEGQGIVVVEADPGDVNTFDSINLARAEALFLTHDDDLRNLDLATLALDRIGRRPESMAPLVLANIIDRETLARELDVAFDTLSRARKARYVRLSPEREGLRLQLDRFAPALTKERGTVSHTLIIGLAGHWRQVIRQLIVSMQDSADETPLLSVLLDDDEAEEFTAWRKRIPDLSLVADTTIIPAEKGVVVPAEVVKRWDEDKCLPNLIVILGSDTETIERMLQLRAPVADDRLKAPPLLIRRTGPDRLIARLAGLGVEQTDFRNVAAFGGALCAETIERILDGSNEFLAAALHNHYLDRSSQQPLGSTAALAAWRQIPENMRHANRAAAAHLSILLASEGLMAERTRAGEAIFAPDPAMLERLCRVEHRRWMADRIDLGWRHAAKRNDARREHNCLVPFDDLSPADQQKDRDAVLTLLKLAQANGMRIVSRDPAMP